MYFIFSYENLKRLGEISLLRRRRRSMYLKIHYLVNHVNTNLDDRLSTISFKTFSTCSGFILISY